VEELRLRLDEHGQVDEQLLRERYKCATLLKELTPRGEDPLFARSSIKLSVE
jgi:hypothetical protein